jgi:hypothetical protein
MTFNIAEFNAQINRRGLAKNNLFVVRITLPASANFLNEEIPTRDLTFLCRSVDVPEFASRDDEGQTPRISDQARHGQLDLEYSTTAGRVHGRQQLCGQEVLPPMDARDCSL